MEIDFNDILAGKDVKEKPNQNLQPTEKKLTKTDARDRQQSCKITDVDKDLLPTNPHSNVNNFRVSLSDMLKIDKEDQSLQKYKKSLLGNIDEQQLKQDQVAQVEILSVQVVCPDRPKGNINLDLKHTKPGTTLFFQIKQGSVYRLKVTFVVRYDLVFGLKFVNNVYKLMAKVDKDQQKMGSFAPQAKPHVFELSWIQAPSGFIARGQYKGKALFLDNDGIVHCQFDYVLRIDKQW